MASIERAEVTEDTGDDTLDMTEILEDVLRDEGVELEVEEPQQ